MDSCREMAIFSICKPTWKKDECLTLYVLVLLEIIRMEYCCEQANCSIFNVDMNHCFSHSLAAAYYYNIVLED